MAKNYIYCKLSQSQIANVLPEVILPFSSQQSAEDKTPSKSRQLFDPQNKWFLHSSLESQSPSSMSQGSSIVQKSSSIIVGV